jgi:tetratricopeptide (TPR) repeat protein
MQQTVFLSYARKSSRPYAEALQRELGGHKGLAFLDTSDIEAGEQFPQAIVDALLAARTIVVFVDELYFERWYCLRELQVALASYDGLLTRGESEKDGAASFKNIVLALPVAFQSRSLEQLMQLIPPGLRTTDWPKADETARLAELVRRKSETTLPTLREKLGARWTAVREELLQEAALPPPADLKGSRHYLPDLPLSLGKGFKGRANDLWKLHSSLNIIVGEAEPAVSLWAHGGFGKTRIAVEYIRRLGPSTYKGGLFWVNADVDDDALESQFHAILCTVNSGVPDLKTFRESGRNAATELETALSQLPSSDRVLFVVDNVPETPSRELSIWCPTMGKVAAVFTSRKKLKLSNPGIEEHVVRPLSSAASVEVLTRSVPRIRLSEKAWLDVAEWVGWWPLALELLNAALQAGLSPEVLYQKVNDNNPIDELDEQMEALRSEVPPGAMRGASEAFRLSFNQLSDKVRRAAALLGYLSPEPIPEALMESLGSEVIPPDVKNVLRARAIVMPVAEGQVPLFGTIHQVLASFLRSNSENRDGDLRKVGQSLLTIMTPEFCNNPDCWPLMGACRPHAQRISKAIMSRPGPRDTAELGIKIGIMLGILFDAEGHNAKAREIEAAIVPFALEYLGEEDSLTLTSMNNLADSLRLEGQLDDALEILTKVVNTRLRVLGEDHSDTMTSMDGLAETLRERGHLTAAADSHGKLLEIRRRVLGETHADTLKSMNNLAGTLQSQGNYSTALELLKEVMAISRRLRGDNDPFTLKSMNNLASTLKDQGNVWGARHLYEEASNLSSHVLGKEHPFSLTVINNLAETFRELGDLRRAADLHTKVLEIRRRVLGEEHPQTLSSVNNLAVTSRLLGDLKTALNLETRVLEVRGRVLGKKHPNTLTAMHNLAGTLQASGNLTGAADLLKEALEISHQALGQEHPQTLYLMNDLALVKWGLGHLSGAADLLTKAIEGRRRILGEDHADTLQSISYLVRVMQGLGDLTSASNLRAKMLNTLSSMNQVAVTLFHKDVTGAAALLAKILNVSRGMFGEEHPATVSSMQNLAQCFSTLGDVHGAEVLLRKVVEIRRSAQGEEHPDVLAAMSLLATSLRAQNDLSGAAELQRRVIAVSRRVLGEEHVNTLRSMGNLAAILAAQGDHCGTAQVEEEVLAVFRRVFGEEHPHTLGAMNNLAGTLQKLGDLNRAVELQRIVLAMSRKILGEEHAQTLTSMNNLALTLRDQGEIEEATELFRTVVSVSPRVLGEGHSNMLVSMSNLEGVLAAQGEHKEAAELEQQMWRCSVEGWGKNIPTRSDL